MDTWRDYRTKNLSYKAMYIAGKIKGCANFRELFDIGKIEVQKLGYIPISPVDLTPEVSNEEEAIEAMKVDITVLIRCLGGVYVLNNYETSKGANLEITIAQFFNMPIIYQPKN